jgi:hypothetical protein
MWTSIGVVGARIRAVVLLPLIACGRVSFDPISTTQDDPDAAIDIDAAIDAPTDAPGFRATAVRFTKIEGDYIWAGSLANTTNTNKGTYSIWLKFHAGDGQQELLSVAQVVGIGGVLREATNKFHFIMQNCAAFPLLDMQSVGAYTISSGWVHLLASWDLGAGRADLYVNDVNDRAASPSILNGNICYASLKWGIGGLIDGQLDADVAELYAALGTYLDLSVVANRRKFSNAAGRPIDLGTDCTGPTGARPTGCFVGAPAMWNTNKGEGAGFNLQGNGLAMSPDSPNDP